MFCVIRVLLDLMFFFFFKQKTAYEMLRSLVGSEMCIRDRSTQSTGDREAQRHGAAWLTSVPPLRLPALASTTDHGLGIHHRVWMVAVWWGARLLHVPTGPGLRTLPAHAGARGSEWRAVSYTHLTLPTKRIV
eukprot:TRINITY_DN1963_c0_g1_i1.p1 TRINITY_DN1963_c0_g1~~TRINITY_DN1963_c0_g1_i1.p1  ORF type:complete len:133 (-),score=16.19 TRINITY_DN1963_c0_g1_i1:121-519(-)